MTVQSNASSSPKPGFQPGVSGNPGGRPRAGTSMTDALRQVLDEVPKLKNPQKLTNRELLVMALVRAGKMGNVKALILIFDRMDGKPRDQSLEDAAATIPFLALRELQRRVANPVDDDKEATVT